MNEVRTVDLSEYLRVSLAMEGEQITFNIWKPLNDGPAFDVVAASTTPAPHEVLARFRVDGAKGMERLGLLFSMTDVQNSDIAAHIRYEHGVWVGYDEAGLEHTRDICYLKVRQSMLDYATVLDVPLGDHFPGPGETWRHHNGNEYEVLMLTNQYSDRPEYPCNVVYQGANGKVWSKVLLNFLLTMEFVKGPEEVACDPVEETSLGVIGVREGLYWAANETQDTTPQADIDLLYSKDSGRCTGSDNIWHAAIVVNGRDEEHVKELRGLVIEGLKAMLQPAPTLRNSLDFEAKLAQFHEAVWDGCVEDKAYDLAGVDVAKELIAMYRGEEKYTHHLDMPIIEGLDLSGCTPLTWPGTEEAKQQFIVAWGGPGPVDGEGEPFALDQWWVAELESMSSLGPISKDQYRATRVALNLAKAVLPATEGGLVYPGCAEVPSEGTYLLEKGEQVVAPEDPAGDHMFERFIRPSE